jgi:hypothetical protein
LAKNGLGYILGDFFTNSSGVDDMITILCDFPNFRRKKWRFFLNTNVMTNFFSKFSFVLNQKTPIFGESILKIITSVPGHPAPCGPVI